MNRDLWNITVFTIVETWRMYAYLFYCSFNFSVCWKLSKHEGEVPSSATLAHELRQHHCILLCLSFLRCQMGTIESCVYWGKVLKTAPAVINSCKWAWHCPLWWWGTRVHRPTPIWAPVGISKCPRLSLPPTESLCVAQDPALMIPHSSHDFQA